MTVTGIALRSIARRMGRSAILVGIDFELAPGERVAILGPSGSGKSSLLRLISGLDTPDEGQIEMDGRVASAPGRAVVPPHERGIGMVFQDLALWPTLNVRDNVALGLAHLHGRVGATERATNALATCGIEALALRSPGTLSGGEQQRVALARALAVEPRWLLLDEPFGGVDLATRRTLLADMATVLDKSGTGMLMVTHDPMDAVALCRRAIVLETGRVSADGDLRALLRDRQSATLRAFADSVHAAANLLRPAEAGPS